jgi:hypothetical protein
VAVTLRLDDVRRAWDARDPQIVRLVAQLATQPDPPPDTPVRQGAPTFERWLANQKDYRFRRKSKEEQAHDRIEGMKALEAPTAEVPLPDRLKAHEVIYALWQSDDPLARDFLLRIIATVPLVYGPWRALKRIYKEAEAKPDTEVFGALTARFDAAHAGGGKQVSGATLSYLSRRSWRFLRRVAVQLPATYADVAADVLARYPANTNFDGTWVANHIFFHESKRYGRASFSFGYRDRPKPSDLKHRAYPELWKRSPRPLFSLLERARADAVREFAAAALKADFRQVLRDVEPAWVVRLVGVGSGPVDEFVVWILQNVPKFEQGAFRTLGLHEAVLRLFDSPSDAARKYAADYARTHARDLTVEQVVRSADNSSEAVRKLARDLLGERDPRKDVGLDAWGRLLESEHGHKFAAEVITKAFGPKDLTPAWFQDRMLARNSDAFEFASKLLPKVHPNKDLGPGFYISLLRRTDLENWLHQRYVVPFAVAQLKTFDLNAVDPDGLRWLALYPLTAEAVFGWVREGKLKPQALGLAFWKAVAFHPDWDADPWLAEFRAKNGQWAKDLAFDDARAGRVLEWFADVRKFTAAELGFEWLLRLATRSEPLYREFATDRLVRSFTPADFAPQGGSAPVATGGPTTADLGKASFLFTGKLASMTRDEAEAKVKGANGTVAGSVTAKLHYLVIGDEGSPLYGQGKKGSKQVKAEELNASGANIRIISETMFLQMLAGQQRESGADATLAGCERLWQMVLAPGPADSPLGTFARTYIRRHHPDIAKAETDRPVDPGAEIPASFLTWERVRPLFAETRKPIRDFALALAKWEFARWNPPVDDLVTLSENPFADVRRFVAKALLAEPGAEAKRYRIDPATLEAAAVYRFCESGDDETRALGMELIRRLPKLRVPEELFRLTESPDRRVRAFVIHALWAVYRDRGVTADWKPPVPPQPQVGAKAKKDAARQAAAVGDGVPHRPEQPPADRPSLAAFLRRVLFEIPPGPPEKGRVSERPEAGEEPDEPREEKAVETKPLPARRAKLDLVEVMRDLALADREFAAGILPLLDEFMVSRGASERAACLVAVTRIRHRYPDLKA